MSTKVCASCHNSKPRDQFSTTQFKKARGHRQCVKCISSNTSPPVSLPLPPQVNLVPQNMELTISQQIFQLQQENHLLKLEVIKCRQESDQKSIQISKYADMLPQLHYEIQRLHQENDDLRFEISQLKSRVKILEQKEAADHIVLQLQQYGNQIQILLLAKERQRQNVIRRLMDYIKVNENLKNQLSDEAKNFITSKSTKNRAATIAPAPATPATDHNFSQDLIKEAIRSENKPQFQSFFIEMYCLVFGEYEDDEDDEEEFW
jgi:regulator of replication initiation timing